MESCCLKTFPEKKTGMLAFNAVVLVSAFLPVMKVYAGSAIISDNIHSEIFRMSDLMALPVLVLSGIFCLISMIYIWITRIKKKAEKTVRELEVKNAGLEENLAKLSERVQLLTTISNNSADFIIKLDSGLKILYASPGVSLLTTTDPGNLSGQTIYETGLPYSLSAVFAGAAAFAFDRKEKQRLDFKSGSGSWFECLFLPETDEASEKIKAMLVTGRDITGIKKTEESLRTSESRYKSFVDNMPGAVYRCRRDDKWQIEFISDAVEDITGFPAEMFIGKDIWQYKNIVHPDDQEMVRQTIHEAFFARHRFIAEYRIRHLNGQLRWVYESGHGSVGSDGEICRIDGVIIDITEQHHAEEQMWQLRKYLKNIIDSMPSAIIGVDPAGKITQWNREACRLTKLTAEAVTGKRFFDVFPEPGFGMDNIRAAIMNMAPVKYSKIGFEIKKTKILADITVYPLVSNGVDGAVIRIDDVTGKARMEELVIQSDKMLSIGGLAAGMAHEINNPLAAIIQNLQVIRMRLSENSTINSESAEICGTKISDISCYTEKRGILKMLDLSLESGKRAASIVENMLSFSRKEQTHGEPSDLCEIVEKTLELAASDYDLKKAYDFKTIRIIREYQPDMPSVTCEKNRMQQVFLNIFKNGAQAMFGFNSDKDSAVPAPFFKIKIYVKRKMACVEIEDNGPGIDEETRKRIFEPFFTTKPVGHGTGLGLSLAYFIVTENHGGFMEVDSDYGKGCRILVKLPLAWNQR